MNYLKPATWIKLVFETKTRFHKTVLVALIVLMLLVHILVYMTGGIKYVYSHTMYIPIIIAAIAFGVKGGLIAGIVGGLLLGPIMPITVEPIVEDQALINWIYRLLIFTLIGSILGLLFDALRRQYSIIRTLYRRDASTDIMYANVFIADMGEIPIGNQTVIITLEVNNYEDLIVLIGRDAYARFVREMHNNIQVIVGDFTMVHMDRSKFGLVLNKKVFKDTFEDMVEHLSNQSFIDANIPMFIDFSMGVFMPDTGNESYIDAFLNSELACLYAKNNNQLYAVYEPSYFDVRSDFELLAALPLAIKEDQFFLTYQPIIDYETGEISSIEALLRWQNNDKLVMPLDFIPMAEETRIIDMITEWVVERVVKDYEVIKTFSDAGININISHRNLQNSKLIERLIEIVDKSKKTGLNIAIEITESSIMVNQRLTNMWISTMKKHHITTLIDDFGTGYASLSALSGLSVDRIKIDQEFIFKIDKDKKTADLVEIIINYAHSLGLKVVAEGVERQSVVDLLKSFGCDYGQGYYYSKPLKLKALKKWVNGYKA